MLGKLRKERVMKFAANLSGGFSVTLDNEWTISAFFGPGSYCSNHYMNRAEAALRGWVVAEEDVELLIYKGSSVNSFCIDFDALDEGRLVLERDSDPMEHVPNERVIQIINTLQSLTEETDPCRLNEYMVVRDTFDTDNPYIEDLRRVNAYSDKHAIQKVVKTLLVYEDDDGGYYEEATGAKIRAQLIGPASSTDEELDAWYSDFEYVKK